MTLSEWWLYYTVYCKNQTKDCRWCTIPRCAILEFCALTVIMCIPHTPINEGEKNHFKTVSFHSSEEDGETAFTEHDSQLTKAHVTLKRKRLSLSSWEQWSIKHITAPLTWGPTSYKPIFTAYTSTTVVKKNNKPASPLSGVNLHLTINTRWFQLSKLSFCGQQ